MLPKQASLYDVRSSQAPRFPNGDRAASSSKNYLLLLACETRLHLKVKLTLPRSRMVKMREPMAAASSRRA